MTNYHYLKSIDLMDKYIKGIYLKQYFQKIIIKRGEKFLEEIKKIRDFLCIIVTCKITFGKFQAFQKFKIV